MLSFMHISIKIKFHQFKKYLSNFCKFTYVCYIQLIIKLLFTYINVYNIDSYNIMYKCMLIKC